MKSIDWVQILPALNACFNAAATFFLTCGFYFIRSDKQKYKYHHRACMLSALLLSTCFLALYVSHKYLKARHGSEINTHFTGEGIWPWIYYPMLISHVILAMLILPLILNTFRLALNGNWERHRNWARWTFPLWYYVSITGVLIYFFLYHWFP